MTKAEILALAERVKGLDYITCPLCGETDFDVSGFSMHMHRSCLVSNAVGMSNRNIEVATALRAIAEGMSDD